MSLSRALTILSDDEHTERVLRDILALFGHHSHEWLSEGDVQTKTGRSPQDVHAILPVLSDTYVLDFDRGRIRPRGAWERAVLERLQRSPVTEVVVTNTIAIAEVIITPGSGTRMVAFESSETRKIPG